MKRLNYDQIAKLAQTRGLRPLRLRANQLAAIKNTQGDTGLHAAARYGCLDQIRGGARQKQVRGTVNQQGVSVRHEVILMGHLRHHKMSCFALWAAGGRRGGMRRVPPDSLLAAAHFFPASHNPTRKNSVICVAAQIVFMRYPDLNELVSPRLSSERSTDTNYRERHKLRLDFNAAQTESIRARLREIGLSLLINNYSHHWIIKGSCGFAQWWPSSGKFLDGENWTCGFHVLDGNQLIALLRREAWCRKRPRFWKAGRPRDSRRFKPRLPGLFGPSN